MKILAKLNNEVVIRDATIEDLTGIVAIYNSTIPSRMVTAELKPATVDSKQEWFCRHTVKRPIRVITDNNGTIIGWTSIEPFINREAYNYTAEISIYLAREWRGKGIGKQLLQYIISTAKGLDIKVLLGYIFSHNTPSLNLFHSLGFEDWAFLPGVATLDGFERDLQIVGKRIQ